MAMEQQPRNERRAGGLLCPTCGLVQTHERIFAMAAFGKVAGLGRKAKTNHEVYKGICLVCNSQMQAKLKLNEPLDNISASPPTIVRKQVGVLGLAINAGICIDEKLEEDGNSAMPAPEPRRTEVSDITMDQYHGMANARGGLAYHSSSHNYYDVQSIQETLEDIFEDDVQVIPGNSTGTKLFLPGEPKTPKSQAHARTQSNKSLHQRNNNQANNNGQFKTQTHRRSRSSPISSAAHQLLNDEGAQVRNGKSMPKQELLRLPNSKGKKVHRNLSREGRGQHNEQTDDRHNLRLNIGESLSFPGAHNKYKMDDREETCNNIFNMTGAFGEESPPGQVRRLHSSPVTQCYNHTQDLSNVSTYQTPPHQSLSAPVSGVHLVQKEMELSGLNYEKVSSSQDRINSKLSFDSGGYESITSNRSLDHSTLQEINNKDECHQNHESKSPQSIFSCESNSQSQDEVGHYVTDRLSTVADCTSRSDMLLEIYVQNSSSADNVISALDEIHELRLDNQMDGEWLQALFTIMTSHKSNAKVQSQVFSTIYSIISDNEQSIIDLELSEAQASDILHVMEMHILDQLVLEHLCGTISTIALVEHNALSLLQACNGKIVQVLMDALQCPGRTFKAKENALKALSHLITASLSSDTNLDKVVWTLLGNGSLIDSIVACFQKCPNSTSIQDAVYDILSNVIAPSSEKGTIESLRACLIIITTLGDNRNDTINSRFIAIEALQRFHDSASVQEIACRVLASTYTIASKKESIYENGSVVNDFELMTNSLAAHIQHAANAAAACTALHNFCTLLSTSGLSGELSLTAITKSVTEVVNVLKNYGQDQQLLETAAGSLYALCGMKDEWVIPHSTVILIVSTMNRYPDSIVLQKHGIEILWLFFSSIGKASENDLVFSFLDDDLITAIVRCVTKPNEECECDTAMKILLDLSKMGCQAEQIFLRNEHIIESIVECQFRWPNSFSIQGSAALILSNIALYQTTRREICHMGGTSRVITALKHLTRDPVFVCKAFDSLANLFSGADVEILRSEELLAPAILVRAMKRHPQNISVQVKGAHALWVLLGQDEHFEDEVVDLGGAEVITKAISNFLGSKNMLTNGSLALWALAGSSKMTQDDCRKTRIGKLAIEPVVNGLSAHIGKGGMSQEGISSEDTCIAALSCLKCLSASPANRVLFEAAGALEVIYSCIWQHYSNPQVCKDALAALCNISVRSTATNEVSDMNDNRLEAVVLAMRTHQVGARATMQSKQAERVVQENAIRLLRNSTFQSTNIEVLRQNPDLSSLIRFAIPYIEDDCRERAEDLLNVLSQQIDQSTNYLEVGHGQFLL